MPERCPRRKCRATAKSEGGDARSGVQGVGLDRGVVAEAIGERTGADHDTGGESARAEVGGGSVDRAPTVIRGDVLESVKTDDCPECGDPMVMNRLMRRYECHCGFHGKGIR